MRGPGDYPSGVYRSPGRGSLCLGITSSPTWVISGLTSSPTWVISGYPSRECLPRRAVGSYPILRKTGSQPDPPDLVPTQLIYLNLELPSDSGPGFKSGLNSIRKLDLLQAPFVSSLCLCLLPCSLAYRSDDVVGSGTDHIASPCTPQQPIASANFPESKTSKKFKITFF